MKVTDTLNSGRGQYRVRREGYVSIPASSASRAPERRQPVTTKTSRAAGSIAAPKVVEVPMVEAEPKPLSLKEQLHQAYQLRTELFSCGWAHPTPESEAYVATLNKIAELEKLIGDAAQNG